MDKPTEEQRRKNMRAVKCKDSEIERLLRSELWKRGYRYRKNDRRLEGKPDVVLSKYKIAVFCDSEFWHGYNWDVRKEDIKSNREFWIKKIEGNMKRDAAVNEILQKQGWTVLRFWGKDIQRRLAACVNEVEKAIEKNKNYLNRTYRDGLRT